MTMIVATLERSWKRYANNKTMKILIIVVLVNYY